MKNSSLSIQSVRTREYLQAVAQKGKLDFISQERKQPVAPRVPSTRLIAERASAAPQMLQVIHGQRYEASCHWGLNE